MHSAFSGTVWLVGRLARRIDNRINLLIKNVF
jgi:hypothetical protein